MATSMDLSSIVYPEVIDYYAANSTEKTLRDAQYLDIFGSINVELALMSKTLEESKTKKTPQTVFIQNTLQGLSELNFPNIVKMCFTLYDKHCDADYGNCFDADLGWLSRRRKGEFNIAFDIHHNDLSKTFEETKFFMQIKALRLYVAELFKKYVGSYEPQDFVSSKVNYRVGSSYRTSDEFVTFCYELMHVHIEFSKYSERLSEFSSLFKASGELATKYREELNARHQQKADRVENGEFKLVVKKKTQRNNSSNGRARFATK
jgi:hypothetical protein